VIREFYLFKEPALLAAIRLGNRQDERHIINHVLVHIYSVVQERSELLMGLLLELVVTTLSGMRMCGGWSIRS
jgi:hypothetical protein